MDIIYLRGKPVRISTHATLQAIERGIVLPEQLRTVLKTGKIKQLRGDHFKILGKTICCVAIEKEEIILIKTVVRI